MMGQGVSFCIYVFAYVQAFSSYVYLLVFIDIFYLSFLCAYIFSFRLVTLFCTSVFLYSVLHIDKYVLHIRLKKILGPNFYILNIHRVSGNSEFWPSNGFGGSSLSSEFQPYSSLNS